MTHRVKYLGGFCRLYGQEFRTTNGWYEVDVEAEVIIGAITDSSLLHPLSVPTNTASRLSHSNYYQ